MQPMIAKTIPIGFNKIAWSIFPCKNNTAARVEPHEGQGKCVIVLNQHACKPLFTLLTGLLKLIPIHIILPNIHRKSKNMFSIWSLN